MTTLLAAYGRNRAIGKNGRIPWEIPGERRRFKELCAGKRIIMGRRSFEEIGHALPYCTIIIVSRTLKSAPKGCLLAPSLDAAKALCGNDILVAGGAQLYRQTIAEADVLSVTEIDAEFDGDCFFPDFDETLFTRTVERAVCENGLSYSYVTYRLKSRPPNHQ